MKRVALFALLSLAAASAHAQSLTVAYRQAVAVPVAGALAAFSVDPACLDVKARDEVVHIFAKAPCATHVVVVTADGTQTFEVNVPQPPLPRGATAPGQPGAAVESGSYEIRYTSVPSQLLTSMDYTRRLGDRTVRLQISNAALFTGVEGRSTVSFPSVSYQIITPGREITLLDQTTVVSPLTVNGSLVRGLHFRQGHWQFHAGYTSVASFQSLLLPAQREVLAGLSYRIRLRPDLSLTPNLYFFSGHPSGARHGQRGVVGSLLFEHDLKSGARLTAEVGFSRRLAANVEFQSDRPGQQLRARLRYAPEGFASLGANNLRGFYSDLHWNRRLSSRLSLALHYVGNRYLFSGIDQTNLSSSLNLQYKLDEHWSAFSGVSHSRFTSRIPARPATASLGLPLGVGFASRRFGNQFQYQFSRNDANDRGGHQFRDTVRLSAGSFRVSGFVDRQTQAPTVDLVFRHTPGLEQAIEQLGLNATTPEQIATLLRDNAALAALGYIEGVNVNLSPLRLQLGGSLTWAARGRSRHAISYSLLYSSTDTVSSNVQSAVHTASYSRRLGEAADLFVSFSLFRLRRPGSQSLFKPMFEISLRRRIAGGPAFLIPRRNGILRGIVFEDADRRGKLEPGAPRIAGVEVVLDGVRRARTDRDGRFEFRGVPPGTHQLEVRFQSARPYFFTTPSVVETDVNLEWAFGIAYAKSRLFGQVRNDASEGLTGIAVTAAGKAGRFSARTNGDGKFAFSGVAAGDYELTLEAESLPPGYDLNLQPLAVRVEEGSPASANFTVKAYRSVAGSVSFIDVASDKQVPAAGVTVRIAELNRESVTDAEGNYLFRELPAGTLVLVIEQEDRRFTQAVTLPPGPAQLKNIRFDLGARTPQP